MTRNSAVVAFFDTNVALYAIGSDVAKRARSRSLLSTPGVLSVQVLNEGTSVLRSARSGRVPTDWRHIDTWVIGLTTNHRIVPVTIDTHDRARSYAEQYQLQIYDAAIVASAVLAGCTTLYTEDMHNGLVIDGLTVRNPYA